MLTHLVLPVVGGATAVLTFGLVLVSVDHLTQVAEVADHRLHKLCSCTRRTEWLKVTEGHWSSTFFPQEATGMTTGLTPDWSLHVPP